MEEEAAGEESPAMGVPAAVEAEEDREEGMLTSLTRAESRSSTPSTLTVLLLMLDDWPSNTKYDELAAPAPAGGAEEVSRAVVVVVVVETLGSDSRRIMDVSAID